MAANAYDVCIDGIYYNIVKKAKQATVTYRDQSSSHGQADFYTGDVVIPATIEYEGVTFNVIAIGENAFRYSKPTSVTIPSSVRSIGEKAFDFYYHKMDALYISDMAAWCEIEFSGNSESDYENPLDHSNHFYLNGKEVIDLVIPDGVTKINSFAFRGASTLKSAKLPKSVMSIGAFTFMDCTGLQSVNIPEGITTIEKGVFANCGVASITIPNSVTKIGQSAFYQCKNLKSLTIGTGITTIESQAFAYLDNLEDVYISDLQSWIQIWKEPSNDTNFGMSVLGGPVHYQPLEYAKHLYLNGKEIKDLIIPEGVTTVPADAFLKFVGLTSATIPDWVESFAFSGCTNLKTITVGNGTDKIKLYGCESLSDLEIGSGTSIDISTCNSLKKLATSNITMELKVEKCEKLETLVLGKSLQKCYISGCKELTDVYCSMVPCLNSAGFDDVCQIEYATLHAPEIVLKDYAATEPWSKFGTIVALKNGDPGYVDYSDIIQFADSKVRDLCLKNWDTNGDQLLTPKEAAAVTDLGTVFSEDKTITSFDELRFFTGLTTIGDKAFYNCSKLSRIIVPANVKTIGDFAFNGCSNLSDVALPDGVTAIGQYGFYGCSSFTTLNIPKGVTKIEINTYADCEGIKEIIIPDHIVEIGNYAFARKHGGKMTFEKVYIPSSVKTVGENIFDYVEIKNVHVPDITTWWRTPFVGEDFCHKERSGSPNGSFRLFANGSEVIDLVVPSDIMTIPNNKFYGCTSIASIKFPGKVRFGAYAFQKCTGLTSVLIPIENGNDLGQGTFRECSNLKDVYLPLEKPFGINRGTSAPFSSISKNATLHVPEGSVDAYIKQNYWTYWFPNIVALQEGDPGYEKPNNAVTLTAKSYSRVYGDANPTFEYTVTNGTITSGTPTITCSATPTSPVGTYDIVIAKGTVSNSNVELVKGTLTITKAPLTISAGNYTKKEGEDNPTLKATYNGFKNNETESVLTKKPTITTTATKTSPVGSYPVNVSGADAQNYAITYQNGTLTITKKEESKDDVTLTAKSYSRVYGDANPTFEYTVTNGTITSGTPTITCSATATSPVGTYDIVIAKGTVSNSTVNLIKGTLTITKAPLTISAGNYTKKEGEDNPTFKATYNGFKNNETESVLTKKPTITTTATKTSPVGSYPVTVSGADAQNYAITYQNGTLTITKKSTGDNSLQVGDTFTTNGMKFKVTSISPNEVQVGDNTLTAIDTNTEGAVIIPSTVKDPEGRSYSVTSIGSSAFSQCKKITEISIPEGVTTISDAFFQCTSLTSVNIPSSITRIDVGAFNQCPALAEVHITDLKAWCGIEFANNTTANPLTIAQHLYLNGKEVKNLIIPEGTTKISKYAFNKCNTLTSVTIPAGVTDFGEMAFDSCEGLTSVTCASSISYRAFWKCTNLTSVTLLKGVEIIGARSFAYCEALTKVNIEDIASWCAIEFNDNPLNYAHHLFVNGQEVKELVIPEGVSEIKGGAFVGCTGLSSVNIPSSVTAIGTLAFDGCTGLEEVHSEITEPFSIDRNTFSNETYKKPLYVPYGTKTKYEATNGWKNFKNIVESENSNKFEKDGVTYEILDDETVAITKDNNVQHTQVLPIFVLYDGKSRTVTVIGDGAFKNNQYLTQITIPSTINKIGDGAFAGCVNLAVIIIHVENPIDIAHVRTRAGSSSVFEGVDMETCILYVPDNSVTAYKAADGWKDFKNILPISTLGIQGIGLDGQPFEVYNMQGRKVRHEATSLDGLPKGVYIINGKKVVK